MAGKRQRSPEQLIDRRPPDAFTHRGGQLIDAGAEFQFTLNGWDGGVLHYDSARFGPVPPEVVRPI